MASARASERARAVVSQEHTLDFPFRVIEVVLLERTPRVDRSEAETDRRIAWEALDAVDMAERAYQSYDTLSGGERQRTHFARALAQSHRTVMESSRDIELPIMVFVGNPGILQIHSGPVRKLEEVDGWYNVLDPDFNLHLREEGIGASWVVKKPTAEGTVTSLELYDDKGDTISLLFSKRKEGQRETEAWSSLLQGLPAAG